MNQLIEKLTAESPALGAICIVVVAFLGVLVWIVRIFLRENRVQQTRFISSLTKIHGECEESGKEHREVSKETNRLIGRVTPVLERHEAWITQQQPRPAG